MQAVVLTASVQQLRVDATIRKLCCLLRGVSRADAFGLAAILVMGGLAWLGTCVQQDLAGCMVCQLQGFNCRKAVSGQSETGWWGCTWELRCEVDVEREGVSGGLCLASNLVLGGRGCGCGDSSLTRMG